MNIKAIVKNGSRIKRLERGDNGEQPMILCYKGYCWNMKHLDEPSGKMYIWSLVQDMQEFFVLLLQLFCNLETCDFAISVLSPFLAIS